MSDMLAQLAALAQGQQVATGMVAAALAGTVAYSLRQVPGQAWKAAKDLFSVTLVVEGRDELYPQINRWLARVDAAKRSQRLMVQDEYDYDAGAWGWQITLGRGWHFLWFRGRPLLVNREVSDADGIAKLLGAGVNQRLWIVSPGRNQAALRTLVAEAEAIYKGDGLVRIYFWHGGGYRMADCRRPRPLETVFLPAEKKARLVADAERFAGAREAYRARGTPYRRGYLFEGPPGTGKTSLIFALAGHLGRSVYVINLATVSGDNDLMAAFNEVGSDGVVVIEDIDAADISRDRQLPVATVAAAPGSPPGAPAAVSIQTGQRLTLSGLLNAIDGVAAREGRLLFVTSNHAGKLDPALLRAGRIDVREEIAPLGAGLAWEMFKAFRPDASAGEFEALIADCRLPMPAAELQNLLQTTDAHGVRGVLEAAE